MCIEGWESEDSNRWPCHIGDLGWGEEPLALG